ncbi:hypothetical protein [Deltalipothrixvirus pozzuoliense]|uniref:Uncharacterized protein ORF116 n=1 Tax=Acidianus filamentous virus 2 (isolate Italy/Pozzuoli) TaxID=654910 RepID=Y116_AFV2P|nr:hypothetical protein AFV2_gp50 [Acidianus filamentous virus 2]Q573B9.1 RecName: Full=Uncharacterized protein ORF116 [Acidianus filamentous virus 2 (isolate Pozzuoli)]CAH69437.1 hypothetical protein [Acidianus filamentous virus 2]
MFQLDFDFKDLSRWDNFYRVYKAIHELSMICKPVVKETHKGYHIYCDIELSPEKIMNLRYYFGDDIWRIMYDEQRMIFAPHLFDVLYQEKEVFTITPHGIHVDENYHEYDVTDKVL